MKLTHLRCKETKVRTIPKTLYKIYKLECDVDFMGKIPKSLINKIVYVDL